MNDVPPAKRSDTQSPFAVLSPDVGRGQTQTRVKISEADSNASAAEQEAAPAQPTVPPESLKKPFSSLIPKKVTPSLSPTPAANAPPPPPSQLFAETASMRPPGPTATGRTATTARREATPSSSSRYGTCKEHGTALTSEGKCVLCIREKAKRDAQNTRRFLFFLAVVVVAAAAYVVFRVLPS